MSRLNLRIRWSSHRNVEANALGGSLTERLERYVVKADQPGYNRVVRRHPAWEIVFQAVDKTEGR